MGRVRGTLDSLGGSSSMAKEAHSLDSPPSNVNSGSSQLMALALEQTDDALSTSVLTSESTTVRTPAPLVRLPHPLATGHYRDNLPARPSQGHVAGTRQARAH